MRGEVGVESASRTKYSSALRRHINRGKHFDVQVHTPEVTTWCGAYNDMGDTRGEKRTQQYNEKGSRPWEASALREGGSTLTTGVTT
eukprot:scaffold126967_cov18-Tisochrysis_lutea.AAC.2